MAKARPTPDNASVRFEPKDVPPLLPFWLACLIGGFIALVLIAITIGYPLADRQQFRGPLQALPPAPRLEVAPVSQRERYEKEKQKELQAARINAAIDATAKQGWGPPK